MISLYLLLGSLFVSSLFMRSGKKLKRKNMNVVSNYECWIFLNSCKSIIDYKNELFHGREEYCLRTFEKLQDFGKALKKLQDFRKAIGLQ